MGIQLHNELETAAYARTFLDQLVADTQHATVVGLSGDLGAGKTTFTKKVGSALGISDEILSPTFVLAKFYQIPTGKKWTQLVHIDAYRIEDEHELVALRFSELLSDPKKLIIIEWPEQLPSQYPAYAHTLRFDTIDEHIRSVEEIHEQSN